MPSTHQRYGDAMTKYTHRNSRCVIRSSPRTGIFDIVISGEMLRDNGDVCGKRFLRQKVRGREASHAGAG
jgi:hypothetical protein